jgi:hypothetical protein
VHNRLCGSHTPRHSSQLGAVLSGAARVGSVLISDVKDGFAPPNEYREVQKCKFNNSAAIICTDPKFCSGLRCPLLWVLSVGGSAVPLKCRKPLPSAPLFDSKPILKA